jgi:hypothetical protein
MPSFPRSMFPLFTGLTLLAALAASASAATIYVDANLGSGANNGTSWANAYQGPTGLVAAIQAAQPGDQIWVADGVYRPGPVGSDRALTFVPKNGVAIYGGFAGGETLLSQRDWTVHVARLSGDIANNDAAFPSVTGWGENAYHVVTGNLRDASAVLDGFTVTDGDANGAPTDADKGGGVLCVSGSPTFRNLTVVNNRALYGGGGVYVRSANPTFTDCRFTANDASSFGGGVDVESPAAPTFSRSWFSANTGDAGGAVDITGAACTPVFSNCVITGNNASGVSGGGAMLVTGGATVDVINCTVYANSASITIGGIRTSSATTRISNAVIWGNTGPGGSTLNQQLGGSTYQVQYSCIEHAFAGTGNISTSPGLVNPAANDFRPAAGSPLIDAGRNDAVPIGTTADFAGAPRFVNDPATPDTGLGAAPIVDMGALEFQGGGGGGCPQVELHPASAQLCPNVDDYSITVTVLAGTPTGYQWRRNGVDVPGATTATYTFGAGDEGDEGVYTCAVLGASCPPAVTNPCTVVVCSTDWNCDDVVNSTDVSEFINSWFADQVGGTHAADFDHNGVVNSTDVSGFINAWFEEGGEQGCGG